jgi:phage shock protein A
VSAALAAGNEALARDGAEAIARLEAERDAAMTARSLFSAEINRLKSHVGQAESRIAALHRGRRVARASEAVRNLQRGRTEAALPYQATLSDAEATLSRLRERQAEAQAAEEALDAIDASSGPLRAAEKLAAEGFGPRLRTTADDVLARLKAKAAESTIEAQA